MEKILVTGSNGYVGKTVLHHLLQSRLNAHPLQNRLEDVVPKSLDFTFVVHCAGALRHRTQDLYRSNTAVTARLLDGITNRECRIIYISSRAIYAPSNRPLTENSLTLSHGGDEYGLTKLEGEKMIMNSGFPYIILRPTNIYGLGIDNLGIGLVAKALQKFVSRDAVILYSPDRLQDFLYVKDLARIVLLAVRQDELKNIAINCANDPSSLHDLINTFANIFEKKSCLNTSVDLIPGPSARNAIMDNSLLKDTFTRFQFTGVETVFLEMIDYALMLMESD